MGDTEESKERTSVCPVSDHVKEENPVSTGGTGTKNGSSFDTALQYICQFLEKCEREQNLDYEKLIVTFKYLQKCSLSSARVYLLDAGVIDIVGRTYDKLVQGDYGNREVLSSILELLYLVEDMSESVEGKAQCGKYFIDRLLALATTKVQSVNLHRAAVETLCAIITKSPANQQRVIDDRDACLKLFKQCLPSCGDFQLQASLTEVYYRLLKLHPQLLDFMTEKRVRGAMEALLHQQKPDLLAKIKDFVILLNECMGLSRSVYTFLANKILLNGQNVTPSEEKLISFGKAHFSFYQTVCQDINVDGPTILDVEYEDILELKSGSKSILEMVVQDRHNVLTAQVCSKTQPRTVNQHRQVRILVSMAPNDFSLLETHVLPKLQTQTMSSKTGLTSFGMRKSSIGIMTPQSKESNLGFQPRNETERHLPAAPRGILKKSEVKTCQNPNVADESEVVGKENCSKPPDDSARKKENFSEEPAIVKATPQKDLLSNPLASHCKEFPSTEMRSRGTELGNRPDAGKEVPEENAEDLELRVPFSRIVTRLNEFVNPEQEEFPTRHQKSQFPEDIGKDHHSEEERSCSSELNDTRVQACTTKNAFSANRETVGRKNMRFAETDSKPWTPEEIKAGPRVKACDRRVHYNPVTTAIAGSVKSTKDVMADKINMGFKSRSSSVPNVIEQDDKPLLKKLKIGRKIGDIYGFENGPKIEETKKTCETSSKINLEKTEPSMPGKAMSEKNPGQTFETSAKNLQKDELSKAGKAPSRKKSAESPPKKRSTQVTRKYPLRRKACKKPDSQSSDTVSKSDSGRTLTSNSDEEWAPDKENTDPIETESEQHKVGAAKARCQQKGSLRQKACTNPVKKVNLPIRLRSGKSTISKGRVQHTSKVSAAQRRKTACNDVYSFTSDEEERVQFKANITPTRKKNQGGDRRKGRATTLSFTSIQEQLQPGKVHLISQAFKGISQVQHKRQRVQKENQQEAGEPNDNDVLINSKPLDRQQVHKSSKTDKVQRHSRIERWKSSTYTDHRVPESNVDREEWINVSSSDTSGGELSPKTDTDVNVPCTPISADDKELQVITTLIKEFKDRVKSERKRKMTDIVSHTSQLIQHGIEGTQRLIQKDVADFVQISKEKYGQLNSKLEGQTKRMRQVYEQFQKDFNEHIEQYEKLVQEIDETDSQLTDVARKRGQEHKELFERLQETSMRHLAEADQKILSVTKASEAIYGLKSAVEGLMCLEQ